jgi:hypothetical protein
LPSGATCTFISDQAVLAGNSVTIVTLVVDTGSALTGGAPLVGMTRGSSSLVTMGFLPGGVLLGLLFWKGRRRLRGRLQLVGGLLMLILLAGASIGLSGCGGLQINGTPPGNYVFQLTASGNGTGVTQSMNVTLTVTQ